LRTFTYRRTQSLSPTHIHKHTHTHARDVEPMEHTHTHTLAFRHPQQMRSTAHVRRSIHAHMHVGNRVRIAVYSYMMHVYTDHGMYTYDVRWSNGLHKESTTEKRAHVRIRTHAHRLNTRSFIAARAFLVMIHNILRTGPRSRTTIIHGDKHRRAQSHTYTKVTRTYERTYTPCIDETHRHTGRHKDTQTQT